VINNRRDTGQNQNAGNFGSRNILLTDKRSASPWLCSPPLARSFMRHFGSGLGLSMPLFPSFFARLLCDGKKNKRGQSFD